MKNNKPVKPQSSPATGVTKYLGVPIKRRPLSGVLMSSVKVGFYATGLTVLSHHYWWGIVLGAGTIFLFLTALLVEEKIFSLPYAGAEEEPEEANGEGKD